MMNGRKKEKWMEEKRGRNKEERKEEGWEKEPKEKGGRIK